MKKTIWKRGFTLIELLVVVLIIAVLAAVALPQYQKAVGKARYMELIVTGNAIYRAEQIYFMQHGAWTSRLEDLDLEIDKSHLKSCAVSATHGFISCEAKNLEPYYIGYLGIGKRECRVRIPAREIDKEICLAVTGKSSMNVQSDQYYYAVFP